MKQFPLTSLATLVLIIVVLTLTWRALFAIELPTLRPFIKGAQEFRVQRNLVQHLNGYECAEASKALWKALHRNYDEELCKGSAVVILEDQTQRLAKDEEPTLHAVVYFSGRYYDPTKNIIFKRIPKQYTVVAKLTTWEQIETSPYLN